MRALTALTLCGASAVSSCDGSAPLGTLRLLDASTVADVPRARVAGPLRCGVTPADAPGIRVDMAASPYAIGRVLQGPRGGPWTDGDVYAAVPATNFFIADPVCGVRVARYAIHTDRGAAVDDYCVPNTHDVRTLRVGFNGTSVGCCLQFGGDAPGFAMALLDNSLTRLLPFERSPWTAARCAYRDQREGAVAIDVQGARWFRRYNHAFAPIMDAVRLPVASEVVAPAALANIGLWASLWETRVDGNAGLRFEWITDDGTARPSAASPSGWFPSVRALRLLSAREHENGFLALLRLSGEGGASLGAALLCPNDTVLTRGLLDRDVTRAILRPYGAFLALFTLRRDGGDGVVEFTLVAADLSWRREPREILRGPGLVLFDAVPSDQTNELLVWHSVALNPTEHELRIGSLLPMQ